MEYELQERRIVYDASSIRKTVARGYALFVVGTLFLLGLVVWDVVLPMNFVAKWQFGFMMFVLGVLLFMLFLFVIKCIVYFRQATIRVEMDEERIYVISKEEERSLPLSDIYILLKVYNVLTQATVLITRDGKYVAMDQNAFSWFLGGKEVKRISHSFSELTRVLLPYAEKYFTFVNSRRKGQRMRKAAGKYYKNLPKDTTVKKSDSNKKKVIVPYGLMDMVFYSRRAQKYISMLAQDADLFEETVRPEWK